MSESRAQKLELSQAENNAKEKLHAIFSHESWFTTSSRASHMSVLAILSEFPRMGSMRLRVRYPNNRMIRATSLLLLVEAQAELDIIQAVYELNPVVLSKDFDLIYILRSACQYRAPAAVVEYLGLKFPKALRDSHYHQMALSHALRHIPGKRRSSLETIQILLKQCPKSVHFKNAHGDNALGLAIMNGYDIKVVKLILDVMERQSCDDLTSFGIPQRWNFTMDSQGAKSTALVLSRCLAKLNNNNKERLEPFECRPTQWTIEGFDELTQYLAARKDSISSLQLDLPNDSAGLSEERIMNGLKNLCDGSSSVEELELYVAETPPVLLGASLHGLNPEDRQFHQSLRKLVLYGAQELDLSVLCTFLAGEGAPRAVHINSCRIHGGSRKAIISSSNKIERLEVKDCFLSSEGLTSLLELVTELPTLKELSLIAPSDFSEDAAVASDAELPVEPLVDLMRNNIIQMLEIVAYRLDGDLFYYSFLENASLEKYRFTNKKGFARPKVKRVFRRHAQLLAIAMEYGNVTLVDAYIGEIINEPGEDPSSVGGKQSSCPGTTCSSMSKIDYYATLNKFGRSNARDPTETAGCVVNLLCDVVDPYACFPCLDPLRKHNLQYGLLRESLSIWSSTSIVPASS